MLPHTSSAPCETVAKQGLLAPPLLVGTFGSTGANWARGLRLCLPSGSTTASWPHLLKPSKLLGHLAIRVSQLLIGTFGSTLEGLLAPPSSYWRFPT